MPFWLAVVYIVGIGCITGIIAQIIESNHKYRERKIIEASRTNNLAIVCQVLNNRPDIALEDLSKYLETNDTKLH